MAKKKEKKKAAKKAPTAKAGAVKSRYEAPKRKAGKSKKTKPSVGPGRRP